MKGGFGRIRGVAFDLDGTLLDTLPDIASSGNAMLSAVGRRPVSQETVRGFIGDGVAVLAKRLLTGHMDGEPERELFRRALAAFEEHYSAHLSVATRPFDRVAEGLAMLRSRGLPMACVTNKPEAYACTLLDRQGMLHYFDPVIGGDSLPRRKPDPLPLLHCCALWNIPPSELLYCGDSINDVKAARAAGCPIVCVPYGYPGGVQVRDLGADAIVSDVVELARCLSA